MLPRTKLGQIATAVLAVLLLGCCAASAERCVITSGPHYHLVADVVSWSMKVESGRRCLRGVRFADVELERMVLISPPESGQVAVQGWGFTYIPRDGFRGVDSFVLEASGKIQKAVGSSTIRVSVSVVGAESFKGPVPRRD